MVTREEARQKAIESINDLIRKEGGDAVMLKSPRIGKCSWTNNEVKQAILDDRNLLEDDGTEVEGTNPVDMYYDYMKYAEEHHLNK